MSKRKAIFGVLMLALVTVALVQIPYCRSSRDTQGVVISFLGYTNSASTTRLALLSIHNDNPFPIRWRGNWSEIEGETGFKAPTFNPKLPWFDGSLGLGRGDSLVIAVGEPLDISVNGSGRWRFSVKSTRYLLRQRLTDYGFRHPWLKKLPLFSQLQPQDALNPTNFVISSSPWFGK